MFALVYFVHQRFICKLREWTQWSADLCQVYSEDDGEGNRNRDCLRVSVIQVMIIQAGLNVGQLDLVVDTHPSSEGLLQFEMG